MKIGDLLEWLAAGAFTAAATLGLGVAWALVIAGACLGYFGQCHGSTPFPRVARPGWLRRPAWARRKPVEA